MHIYINNEDLKTVLLEIETQSINIAIQNSMGTWLAPYFTIEDVVEFDLNDSTVSLLILRSVNDSKCTIVDIRNILSIKFNKYLNRNGQLLDKIIVLPTSEVLSDESQEAPKATLLTR